MEVMIVIAIVGIMSALVLINFNSTKNNARVKASQREVASAIKLAHSYALQGKTQPRWDGEMVTPCGYGIYFIPASEGENITRYRLFYNMPGGASCDDLNKLAKNRRFIEGESKTEEIQTLESGVYLRFSSGRQVYFTVPHGETYSGAGGALGSAVTMTVRIGSTEKTITINPGGLVEESD